MRRLSPRRPKAPGLSPGTLIHVGQKKSEAIKISYMEYSAADYFAEGEITAIDQLASAVDPGAVTWINVAGLHQIRIIEST
jgi:magnesium transporter